jgi:hypothetical protein
MSGTLSPVGQRTFCDINGVPLSGGKVYTWNAGTATPATTYSDAAMTVPNANPIVLNSRGQCTIVLPASTFDYEIKNSADVLQWTEEDVSAVGLVTSGVYEVFHFGGDPTSPITSAIYPVGATYDKCHAGSRWWTIDSANIAAGTYKLEGMLLVVGAFTVTAALVDLDSGASETPLATISSTSTTGERQISAAISFAVAGTAKRYAIKVKTTGGSASAWGLGLVKIS